MYDAAHDGASEPFWEVNEPIDAALMFSTETGATQHPFEAAGPALQSAPVATLTLSKDPEANPRAVARAILMTSLFFAVVHAPQWPAPIAIFVLSLGLGIVAYKTGSLIAAITMHASFNGLSVLLLCLALLSGAGEKLKKAELPDAGVACNHAIIVQCMDLGDTGGRVFER